MLKSIFTPLYTLFSIIALGVSIYELGVYGVTLRWVGVAVASSLSILYAVLQKNFSATKADPSVPMISAPLTIFGLLPTISTIINPNQSCLLSVSLAGGILSGWYIFLFWSSYLDRDLNKVLKEGKKIPLIETQDVDGKEFSNRYIDHQFVLYLFFRGNWCPVCMTQIDEIAQQYKELEKRDVQVVLISNQEFDKTKELSDKHKLPFRYLMDKNSIIGKKLGLYHKYALPYLFSYLGKKTDALYPTLLITDSSGKILFADLTDNFRLRPEPSTFLKIIDEKNLDFA